ncbi:hypothetical protein SAMN05444156_1309 [Verrucomicrobium sp. GAS474]|uniref:hypothetical protein n=1 Tax=Verrucomicrobium sp. GAS474 TaxID=1882831 RepID=UPI00087C71E3|nr:hypothetical protein [Verrucomicrobium sp. GAS474]SDT99296.1 hypothetical protein SAMN05444156_1309 [Verrucomicrobium sp. GAS474]
MPVALHIDLDGAWSPLAAEIGSTALPTIPLRQWGPALRFCAPASSLAALRDELFPTLCLPEYRGLPILYGSGDFHHLAAVWLQRISTAARHPEAEPLVLLSFDNHPDWAWTPPRWACGGWINRALDLPLVAEAAVWGCGNMELNWPVRLLGNRRAVRKGRLRLFPWRERFPALAPDAWPWLERATWRKAFLDFLKARQGRRFYITVDLDCLRPQEAQTDWENGLFTLDDVAWAVAQVRQAGRLAGGDLCGATSGRGEGELYERPVQRFLARLDHPALPTRTEEEREEGRVMNERAAARLLPLLMATG